MFYKFTFSIKNGYILSGLLIYHIYQEAKRITLKGLNGCACTGMSTVYLLDRKNLNSENVSFLYSMFGKSG